jgi:hypothetical protein
VNRIRGLLHIEKDGDDVKGFLMRLVKPLGSRKVRVAMATVIAAYGAEFGLQLGDEMVLTILGVGVALILGIAHEDAGAKSAGSRLAEAIGKL